MAVAGEPSTSAGDSVNGATRIDFLAVLQAVVKRKHPSAKRPCKVGDGSIKTAIHWVVR